MRTEVRRLQESTTYHCSIGSDGRSWFCNPVGAQGYRRPRGWSIAMDMPEIYYAKSVGNVRIAYQVTGGGPLDLVFVPGFISNLEAWWEEPEWAHLRLRLAAFSRLILFDKRGTGLSDAIAG